MSGYLTGEELLERWEIKPLELHPLIERGHLIPWDDTGDFFYHPKRKEQLDYVNGLKKRVSELYDKDERGRYKIPLSEEEREIEHNELISQIRKYKKSNRLFGTGWTEYGLPFDKEEERAILKALGGRGCLYSKNQIEAIEKDQSLSDRSNIRVPDEVKSTQALPHWNSDIRIEQETVAAEEILRHLVKVFRLRVPQCIWHRPVLG